MKKQQIVATSAKLGVNAPSDLLKEDNMVGPRQIEKY